jgi:hypothetical protein|tara:strand:- start:963 stop:1574 length:612 start_codon:yes stop_codon:yes gene_type:complete
MSDFIIIKEHPDLLTYIDSLQRKNAEQLSFYPKQVFEREQKNGRLYLGLLNGEPCGYIYVGAAGGDVKCHQVCIQYDARRKLYGAMLVLALENYANESLSDSITLRCGFDLDANTFWKELGYNCIAVQQGGIRRNRKINVWRKYLQPQMFSQEWVEPAVGKVDASIWRKHKQTGIISQFNRGKKLEDYRLKIQQTGDAENLTE